MIYVQKEENHNDSACRIVNVYLLTIRNLVNILLKILQVNSIKYSTDNFLQQTIVCQKSNDRSILLFKLLPYCWFHRSSFKGFSIVFPVF